MYAALQQRHQRDGWVPFTGLDYIIGERSVGEDVCTLILLPPPTLIHLPDIHIAEIEGAAFI